MTTPKSVESDQELPLQLINKSYLQINPKIILNIMIMHDCFISNIKYALKAYQKHLGPRLMRIETKTTTYTFKFVDLEGSQYPISPN